MRALQGTASAAFGPAAFDQGVQAAALGVLFHFVIAFSAAAVYCLAAARFRFMLEHPFLIGPLYGIAVHLFMTFVVLPLSRVNRRFAIGYFTVQLVIHTLAVGLSDCAGRSTFYRPQSLMHRLSTKRSSAAVVSFASTR